MTGTNSTTRWSDYLNDYEAKIASAEESLKSGEQFAPEVLQPFEPPTGLGAFPAELSERATALLRRNAGLNDALRVAMDAVSDELGDVKRESSAVRKYDVYSGSVPQYVDHNA